MITVAAVGNGPNVPGTQSYFSLIRRLNLLRQVAEFRAERGFEQPGALLDRTRQFFKARGSVPYQFEAPLALGSYGSEPFGSANVFFGPPDSNQIVVFARRSRNAHYTLVHIADGETVELDEFHLDKRFGSAKRASIVSLFGWRMRSGSYDQYINPVEFDEHGEITIRVNVTVESGPNQELPALLKGSPKDGGYRWSIARLGHAHDWYPDTNSKLFLPGHEPQEVVYGLDNDTFICKGCRKIGSEEQSWAVWSDQWDTQDARPLISNVAADRIGAMAVNILGNGSSVYSFAVGKLPPGHPLEEHTPSIIMARKAGQLCVIPLEGVADIHDIAAVQVGGASSGVFHCTSRGPTNQLHLHQNGVPIGAPFDYLKFYGFHADEVDGSESRVRVRMVVSDDDGRRLSLYTATSTAWPETLSMMGTPLRDLNKQLDQQERSLRDYQESQSGSSVEVLGLDRAKPELEESTVQHWWKYVSGRLARVVGGEPGPYITRAAAMALLDFEVTGPGAPVEPLLAPLADLFGVDVSVRELPGADDELGRLRSEIHGFLDENRLLLRARDVNPDLEGPDGDDIAIILHPAAAAWHGTATTEAEIMDRSAIAVAG